MTTAKRRGRPRKSERVATDVTTDDLMDLRSLLSPVQRRYGDHALTIAGDVEEDIAVSFLPTGIPQIDRLLGGGFPRGRITEVFGPYSAGKSYLLLKAIAETQKNNGVAALVDTEISFSPGMAKALGVDTSRLLLSIPECGEEALEVILSLLRSEIDLIVLDSATSLVPRAILESKAEVPGYDPTVRLWNAGLARIKPALALKKTAFVFSNQVRANMGGGPYAPQTIEPLGWKSKHEATLRLEIRRREWIKIGDERVGQVTVARIEKHKYDGCMPRGSEVTFDIMFNDLKAQPSSQEETDEQ